MKLRKKMSYVSYIISLNQPYEKMKYVNAHNIYPIWFKGLYGKTIDTMDRLDYLSPFFMPIAPYSAIGCAVSHMKVWEKFLVNNHEDYALILEDDVILIEGFKEKLELLLKADIKTWDLMHLGCFGCNPSKTHVNILNTSLTLLGLVDTKSSHQPKTALGLHAYVITRKGAMKLLEGLKGKLWCPIDFGIQWLVATGKINRSAYLPRIAFQSSTDEIDKSSNVTSQHPRWLFQFLSQFHIDEYLRASYLFGGSLIRLGNINLNIISFVFFILGYIGVWIGVRIINLLIFFLMVSLWDIWIGNLVGVIVNFILFMVPTML